MAVKKESENSRKEKEGKMGLSRRNFLKASIGTGIGATIIGYDAMSKPVEKGVAYAAVKLGKKHNTIDEIIEISPDYKRFTQRNTIFMRGKVGDKKVEKYYNMFKDKDSGAIPPSGEAGWTELDHALMTAAWSIEKDAVIGSSAGIPNTGLYAWEGPINPRKTEFSSPEEASRIVKKSC